jgi:hypothetical protein
VGRANGDGSMSAGWPEPTGDPAADAIVSGLDGADELSPGDEVEAYRTALDALSRLLEEHPRLPGMP